LVIETIRTVSKEQKYDLMLTEGVLFASDQVNVTDQVLQRLKDQGAR
jgi:outer membrane protein